MIIFPVCNKPMYNSQKMHKHTENMILRGIKDNFNDN